MKKRLFITLVVILLMITYLPVSASAFGGYVVVKGLSGYHSALCENLSGYNLKDAKWYKTLNEVKKTKLNAASCCGDNEYDYEDDDASMWNSDDWKIDNVLEIERMWGVLDGYDLGSEEGYAEGYNAGLADGIEGGYADGFDVGYDEGKSSAEPSAAGVMLTIGISCISGFVFGKIFQKSAAEEEVKKLKRDKIILECELNNLKNN